MSDYKRTKAVFYPIDDLEEHLIKLYGCRDLEMVDSLDKYFKRDKFSRVYAEGYFNTEVFLNYSGDQKTRHYLIFVLQSTYGDENGEFGRQRHLTNNELEKWAPRFNNVLQTPIEYDKLKLLDYCYYNCSECDDYYLDQNERHDEFYDEV